MEYQGIIAGIGDKSTNTNLIPPELDSAINNFIIGTNTIIQGLELKGDIENGYTLSAGVCIFNGVRGILENDITISYKELSKYQTISARF